EASSASELLSATALNDNLVDAAISRYRKKKLECTLELTEDEMRAIEKVKEEEAEKKKAEEAEKKKAEEAEKKDQEEQEIKKTKELLKEQDNIIKVEAAQEETKMPAIVAPQANKPEVEEDVLNVMLPFPEHLLDIDNIDPGLLEGDQEPLGDISDSALEDDPVGSVLSSNPRRVQSPGRLPLRQRDAPPKATSIGPEDPAVAKPPSPPQLPPHSQSGASAVNLGGPHSRDELASLDMIGTGLANIAAHMVSDSALSHMDSQDVEDLFKGVLSESAPPPQPEPVLLAGHTHQAPPPAPPQPIREHMAPSQPIRQPMHHAHAVSMEGAYHHHPPATPQYRYPPASMGMPQQPAPPHLASPDPHHPQQLVSPTTGHLVTQGPPPLLSPGAPMTNRGPPMGQTPPHAISPSHGGAGPPAMPPSPSPMGGPSPGMHSVVQQKAPTPPAPPVTPTGTETQSSNSSARSSARWEADEALGSMATISSVLFANLKHPELKENFPSELEG
ncbi:unnamed protein product, partial [Cyprideis torosa]